MHIYSTNPAVRAAMERASAERAAAFRSLFAPFFARKERPVTGAAQAI